MNAVRQIADGMRYQNPLIPPPEGLPHSAPEAFPWAPVMLPSDPGYPGVRSFELNEDEAWPA